MKTCSVCKQQVPTKFLCKVNLIYGTEFDLVQCSNCMVIYFDPLPSVEQLATFYSSSYYDFDRWREEGKGMAFSRHLKKWKPTGKFVDVGCATGFFINGIKKHSNWEVYGTDFGKSAVGFARNTLGLNVFEGDLKDAKFPDAYFDYVHVNNVLEHVLDPISLLEESRRIIKPDGIFYLSVPNGFNDSLDLIDFYTKEKKPARSKNGHIFFFPAQTLLRMFEQIGFKVQTQHTYSLKRGMRSIGYLRRKNDWKNDYFPKLEKEKPTSNEIVLDEKKRKHSDFYYHYRYIQGNLSHIPGLYDFGLDFQFIMKPL